MTLNITSHVSSPDTPIPMPKRPAPKIVALIFAAEFTMFESFNVSIYELSINFVLA